MLPHYLITATSLLENAMPMLTAGDLAALLPPTALLLGTEDNFASQDLGQKISAAMPKGRFFSIVGAGHLPWLEAPAECAKIILDFFA